MLLAGAPTDKMVALAPQNDHIFELRMPKHLSTDSIFASVDNDRFLDSGYVFANLDDSRREAAGELVTECGGYWLPKGNCRQQTIRGSS